MHSTVFAWSVGALTWLCLSADAHADIRSVGPGKTHAAPCAAFAAASDGDTIEIAADGSYVGDVCVITKNNLTIRGVGGRAHVQAGGKSAAGKGTWVIQGRDTVVEDIELSGASVPDKNGAGIRQEGRNLTVRRSFFHDNENGILGGADAESSYVIEDSEFANNGAGDGQSHNMYIGVIKSFTLRGSYSHHAKVGHLVKSRALRNYILYNRLTDETGRASYELDLPQGGPSFVIGNIFQQSATTENPSLIAYALEGTRNPGSALWVVANTFFNARASGTFVRAASSVEAVTLRGNIFAGPGTVCDFAAAVDEGNFVGDAGFVDAAKYDFHLRADSKAVDRGVAPGMVNGESLTPLCQYEHPAHAVVRDQVGALDQGSLELGSSSNTPCGASPSVPTSAPDASVDMPMLPGLLDGGATRADAAAASDAATSPRAEAGAPAEVLPPKDADGGCRAGPSARSPVLTLVAALLIAAALIRRRAG